MPYKDPTRRREYSRQWIADRRASWFAGKICALCGGMQDLELDHTDPTTKVSHRIWSWSEARREAELAKCRVLCKACHGKKSATEVSRGEELPQARLKEADVRMILASSLSYAVLAAQYGVDKVTIGKIKRGEKWKHISKALSANG